MKIEEIKIEAPCEGCTARYQLVHWHRVNQMVHCVLCKEMRGDRVRLCVNPLHWLAWAATVYASPIEV